MINIQANSKHSFQIKKAFNKKEINSPKDYLDAVLDVEKTISRFKVENNEEIFWNEELFSKKDTKIDESFGYGTSGIAYFYINLYEATKDEKYLKIVKKAANHISKNWKNNIPAEPHKYTWPDGMHFGIYGGISGIGGTLVFIKKFLQKFSDSENAIKNIDNALSEIVEYLKSKAVKNENGIVWTGSPVTLADGGILIFLTSLYESFPTSELKEFLEKASNAYLKNGISHENGGLEFSDYETCLLSEPDFPYKVSQPNFELGSAGAGFILTRIYEALKDEKYLEAAKKVEIYLDSIKVQQEKGFLLPYRVAKNEEDQDKIETFFYLGNCHGAVGSAKFYFNLYKTSGDKKYLEKLHSLIDGFESLGAPNFMSKGLWNNTSICCGHGGILNTFVGLYNATKENRWLELSKTSASILLGEKDEVEKGFNSWPIAYRRVVPTEFSYTIFYNDGTSGSATALLKLYLAEN